MHHFIVMPTRSDVANEILVMGRFPPTGALIATSWTFLVEPGNCLAASSEPQWAINPSEGAEHLYDLQSCVQLLAVVKTCHSSRVLTGIAILLSEVFIKEKHFWIHLGWKWYFMWFHTWRDVSHKSHMKEIIHTLLCVWSVNCYLHRFILKTHHSPCDFTFLIA